MNASDRLADLYTIRQLLLQRLAAGEQIKLNRQFDDIAVELERSLKNGKPLTEYQGRRLDQAISDLAKMVNVKTPQLGDLARLEADFARNSLINFSIDAALPPASVINQIADTSLVQGASVGDWFSRLNSGMRFDMARAIKVGVSLGETNAQIAKRIIGAGGDKGAEVLPKGRRDAVAVTRTAVQTVANEARIATFEANADIIKSVQWISTLDSRTSEICIARSGLQWTVPGFKPIKHEIPWNGGPPAHWACRSTVIPITKTFRELGVDQDEVPASTRASMDGQAAADLTFAKFLERKPPEFADEMLGKGRAQLWRDGKITLQDLLNPRGVPLTLRELERKYGAPSTTIARQQEVQTQQAVSSIDSLINAIRDYQYSEEYLIAKGRAEEAQKAYDEQRQIWNALPYSERTNERAVPIVNARQNHLTLQSEYLALRNKEVNSLVGKLELPSDRQGDPASIINGTISPTVKKQLNEAARLIAKLVDKDIQPRVNVAVSRSKRAFYTERNRTIHVNGKTSLSTLVHEIIHDLEFAYPEISQKTKAFLVKRANGEQPKSLRRMTGLKYRADERAYEDDWVKRGGDAYMGKLYDDQATELLTMGIERMLKGPKEFAEQDGEYFRFLLEIFRKVA